MAVKEGRISRWSRLKQKGGASREEEGSVLDQRGHDRASDAGTGQNVAYGDDNVMFVPDPAGLPGGDFRRNTIPLMAPLGGVEDTDSDFEAPPADVLALLNGDPAHDGASDVPPIDEVEVELTAEQEDIVAGLPPIDTLTKQSDFTPFLSDKVPEFIRRRALSVLWRSDPVLANIDGLNDYDEDFNIIDTLIDIAKDTNYRVGKGMVDESEDEDENEKENETVNKESDAQDDEPDQAAEGDADANVADDPAETADPNEALDQTEDPDQELETRPDEVPVAAISIRDVRKPDA